MLDFNLKTRLGITGKMSAKQADKVGNKIANALVLLALAAFIAAVSLWR